ncbi:juvenile hormone acid O-methyltransferase-like [Lutzomyia longipalpis]|uniref:juvenile hormone acid O-methyltransferase-like n=1 Tax=Lutzomyia longipalpis TaxID=7200 RepID=UPI002483C9A1|nr:juvenile hormone acid O-methyltransferase-like [Lutzomyia longipalpis]
MSVGFDSHLINQFNRIRDSELKPIFSKYGYLLNWTPKEAILDVGCGTGDISSKFIYPLIPKNYSRYVCSDISPTMLKEAEKKFAGKPRVSFELLDITKKLNETNTFDHIFSMWCLMWVADQSKAFKNMYELLAPGGRSFHVFIQRHIFMETILEVIQRPKWKKFIPNPREVYPFPYQNDPDPVERIRSMMKKIGYVNVEVYLEPNTFAFANKEEFFGFLMTLPNPLHLMTKPEQEEYLRENVELAYVNNVINESGKLEDAGDNLVVYGEKE